MRRGLRQFEFVEVDGVGGDKAVDRALSVERQIVERERIAVSGRSGRGARNEHVDLAKIGNGVRGFKVGGGVVRLVLVRNEDAVAGHALQNRERIDVGNLTADVVAEIRKDIGIQHIVPLDRHTFRRARIRIRHVDGGVVFRIGRLVGGIVVVSPQGKPRRFRLAGIAGLDVVSERIHVVDFAADRPVVVEVVGGNAVERRRDLGGAEFLAVVGRILIFAGRGREETAVRAVGQNLRPDIDVLIRVLARTAHEPRVSESKIRRVVGERRSEIIERLLFRRSVDRVVDDRGNAPARIGKHIGKSRRPRHLVAAETVENRRVQVGFNETRAGRVFGRRVRHVERYRVVGRLIEQRLFEFALAHGERRADAGRRYDVGSVLTDRRKIDRRGCGGKTDFRLGSGAQQSRIDGEQLPVFQRFHPETARRKRTFATLSRRARFCIRAKNAIHKIGQKTLT